MRDSWMRPRQLKTMNWMAISHVFTQYNSAGEMYEWFTIHSKKWCLYKGKNYKGARINSAAPRKKAVTDIFDFHFFAKNYNLVNALSCVLVIFLEKKKLNAWKRVFFRFAKSSICICTYEIFPVSPRKKAVSSSPRKKAVSAEIVLFFSLFIITFIINQVLLFSTCI